MRGAPRWKGEYGSYSMSDLREETKARIRQQELRARSYLRTSRHLIRQLRASESISEQLVLKGRIQMLLELTEQIRVEMEQALLDLAVADE